MHIGANLYLDRGLPLALIAHGLDGIVLGEVDADDGQGQL
jgi:hypothetical protein